MAYERKSAGIGLAVGAGLGTAFGVAVDNIGVWLSLGIALGMLLPAWNGWRRIASIKPEKGEF